MMGKPRTPCAAAQALLGATLAMVSSAAAAQVHRGVNLGGWLVTEPWITPSLYSSTNTTCEWELCNALGKDECKSTLQNHYSTFYTRDDFVDIKNAGLTGVRIPLGYWSMVPLEDYEPYVSGQYPYLVRAVQWANELGLNVFLDVHGAPGSQNGWEETGFVGAIGFPDNSSNTDRTLTMLKNLTTEFTKDQYNGAVTNIEVLNEPLLAFPDLVDFYTQASNVVGAANSSGINITISDGFLQPHTWENYNPWDGQASQPAEHLTVDTHQFWGFPPQVALDKVGILNAICEFAQTELRAVPTLGVPPTLVGEWSLNSGVTGNSTSTDTAQDVEKRTWFRTLFEAQNAAFTPNSTEQASIGWYYWTWKTEYDIDAWSYRKGLNLEYIPKNVSDPSTYVFPIGPDGCIDQSFDYTAPDLSGAQSSNGSPTSSGGPSSTLNSSSASGTQTGAAASLRLSSDLVQSLFLAASVVVYTCIAT